MDAQYSTINGQICSGGFGASCPEDNWQNKDAGIFSAKCKDRAGRDRWSDLALSKFIHHSSSNIATLMQFFQMTE